MRKLTLAQQKERKNLEWFGVTLRKFGPPSDESFEEYLDLSERGKSIFIMVHKVV